METNKDNILEFVTVSKEIIALIESADGLKSEDLIIKARQMLPVLYFKASLLPELENSLKSEELEQYVTPEHYDYIKLTIKEKLGDYDATVQLEDNFLMNTEDYMHVEISELFADIYQDIGNFMAQYRDGDDVIRNDATWECKYNFEQYWGLRVLILTEHLHRLINSDEFEGKN